MLPFGGNERQYVDLHMLQCTEYEIIEGKMAMAVQNNLSQHDNCPCPPIHLI